MSLFDSLMNEFSAGDLQKIGSQLGIQSSDVERVMAQVVPALGQGVAKNASQSGGLDSLVKALQKGNHQQYVNDIGQAASSAGIQDGNNILGHIFGSKAVSRNVAQQASAESGINPDVIKQMLPILATMVMGTLSKKTDGGQQLPQGSSDPLGGLGALLGGNGGGLGDVLDIAKKFF